VPITFIASTNHRTGPAYGRVPAWVRTFGGKPQT
jgi:hypothetical protein